MAILCVDIFFQGLLKAPSTHNVCIAYSILWRNIMFVWRYSGLVAIGDLLNVATEPYTNVMTLIILTSPSFLVVVNIIAVRSCDIPFVQ